MRQKGIPNRKKPGDLDYIKIGRPPARHKLPSPMSADAILTAKVQIIELFIAQKVRTITEAAQLLHLSPQAVWGWVRRDEDFADLLEGARQVAADKIEAEFQDHANFIPKMMLLKGYRPMFRENFKIEHTSKGLEDTLAELKKLSAQQEKT